MCASPFDCLFQRQFNGKQEQFEFGLRTHQNECCTKSWDAFTDVIIMAAYVAVVNNVIGDGSAVVVADAFVDGAHVDVIVETV